ncbi:Zinc finger matrin-type protein 2 [Coccomyxa sp. Obi]|nr:Zinc finger matrin-type protein 2 [Coccomyxa sp. Obi]
MAGDERALVKKEGGNRRERREKEKKGKASGVDNTFRRTWDKDEYAEKAEAREKEEQEEEESALDAKRRKRLERDPLHQGIIVERAKLKQRDFSLDLTSRLGKSQVITNTTPLNQQAGYYCSVCDCILRDSASYLDHINGKYHNRALGMSMRVERSTADQVRERLSKHKEKKYESEQVDFVPDGFDRRVLEQQEEEERLREQRRERKREKRKGGQDEEEEYGADPDMALAMGFSGFGGSR